MEFQTFAGVSHALQTAAIAAVIVASCYFLSQFNYQTQLKRLPVFNYSTEKGEKQRKLFMDSAKELYETGYKQFKKQVYRITAWDGEESVMVGPEFLPELRKLPDDVLSFPQAINENMETKYTGILTEEAIVPHTIKADLTPALSRLNDVINDEVCAAVEEEMPPCDEWTSVPIFKLLCNMVAKVSGRLFVGPEVCRDPEYIDAAINYTIDVVTAQHAIKDIRPWLRPLLAPRCPEIRQLRQREKVAREFLRPILQERLRLEKEDPDWEKPEDMMQWLLARSESFGYDREESIAKFAQIQLGLTFAAIHTTTLTATNILYTLAAEPSYIQPLRDEIREQVRENGGLMTPKALQHMEKLDSFMKEVARFYPAGFTSFSRKVLKGITLSNGQYIPAGLVIEVPSHAIYQDPSIYPDPSTFDGFRFAKARQQTGGVSGARSQFVTTNERDLQFGYGRHACPGRFFAANEIKMMLAKLLLEYDIKNVDGVEGRYPNIEIGKSSIPDSSKELMFRKKRV